MRSAKCLLPLLLLGLSVSPAAAQTPEDKLPPVPATSAAPANGVVAKVNGQAIAESAVQRCFRIKRVPPNRQADARPSIVDFLIETTLVDQYLAQLKIEPDKKEVDTR